MGVQTDSIACVGVFVLVSIWSPIAEVVIYADHREAVTMEVNCHHNRMTVARKTARPDAASTAFLIPASQCIGDLASRFFESSVFASQ